MERPAPDRRFPRIASAPRTMERRQHGDDGSGPRLINRRRPAYIEVERLYAAIGNPDRMDRITARVFAFAILRNGGSKRA